MYATIIEYNSINYRFTIIDGGVYEYRIKINDDEYTLTPEDREIIIDFLYNNQTENSIGIRRNMDNSPLFQDFAKKFISERIEQISEEEFFGTIKSILEINKNLNVNYKNELKNALIEYKKTVSTGQKSLQTKIENNILQIFCGQVISKMMSCSGYILYGKLEELTKKVKQSKEPIFINRWENFPFAIPTLVEVETKKAVQKKEYGKEYYNPYQIFLDAKQTQLFYDFIVVHYDKRSAEIIEEEKRKNCDPIIFGIVKGTQGENNWRNNVSDNSMLIPITDWIDPNCDLTIEEFIKRSDEVNVDISTLKNKNNKTLVKDIINNLIKEVDKDLEKDLKHVLEKHKIDIPQNIFTRLKKIFTKKKKTRFQL